MERDDVVMEYQVESQRGITILGTQKYSSSVLLPWDPRPFTTLENKPLGRNLRDFEVPDDTWVWVWPCWHVDMCPGVDDQGWSYSWQFRSKHWTETNRLWRSFVRQRLWKRPRVKKALSEKIPAPAELLDLDNCEGPVEVAAPKDEAKNLISVPDAELDIESLGVKDRLEHNPIFRILDQQRNDREKVEAIVKYVSSHTEELAYLVRDKEQIIGQLVYPVSQQLLAEKLASSATEGNESSKIFLLAPPDSWWTRVYQRGEPDSLENPLAGEAVDV